MSSSILQLTSGDCAGSLLRQAGVPGEVLVWHDILYDGPRNGPGWPDEATLEARAAFLERSLDGGLPQAKILATLRTQYQRLAAAASYDRLVLWFDACLFDQAMLAHLLACLSQRAFRNVFLLCVDAFPGIVPYHGLGQLSPAQLASLAGTERPVTEAQYRFSVHVDRAFAVQDADLLDGLRKTIGAPLPWIPAAAARWLRERPDPVTGLGFLEGLALEAVRKGCATPAEIFAAVAAADVPPQYWGDTTLWAKVNALALRGQVRITGPAARLPQWESPFPLGEFRVSPV